MNTEQKQSSVSGLKVHDLKTWPEYFQAVKRGEKKFELRLNDRNFKVGDVLHLKEWRYKGYSSVSPNMNEGEYTGEELFVKVTYIFAPTDILHSFGLFKGYCIMAIEWLEETPSGEIDNVGSDKLYEFAKFMNQWYGENEQLSDGYLKNVVKDFVASKVQPSEPVASHSSGVDNSTEQRKQSPNVCDDDDINSYFISKAEWTVPYHWNDGAKWKIAFYAYLQGVRSILELPKLSAACKESLLTELKVCAKNALTKEDGVSIDSTSLLNSDKNDAVGDTTTVESTNADGNKKTPSIDWEGLVNDMLNLLTNIGQLLQPVKSDWEAENCWSDWDEEQVTENVKMLRRLYQIKDQLAQNKITGLH